MTTTISGTSGITPPAPFPDLSNGDNQQKAIKAVLLVVAEWSGKTVPEAYAAFKTAYDGIG